MTEILDVVNEHDEVIGQAERERVHREGLICRMAFVLFYTPDKHIILQRRSMAKKSNPGKLTTTVSGHVESGSTYDETASKEALEETGVSISPDRLTRVSVMYAEYSENNSDSTYLSNAMRACYVYLFKGGLDELKVEEGEGAGFETMSIDEFRQMRATHPEEFAPYLLDEIGTRLIDSIERL